MCTTNLDFIHIQAVFFMIRVMKKIRFDENCAFFCLLFSEARNKSIFYKYCTEKKSITIKSYSDYHYYIGICENRVYAYKTRWVLRLRSRTRDLRGVALDGRNIGISRVADKPFTDNRELLPVVKKKLGFPSIRHALRAAYE